MVDQKVLRQTMATILCVSLEKITEDSSMDTIPGWDSLKHMNLVLAIEDEFQVCIPDDDAANITSYQLIKMVLEELLGEVA